MFKNNLYAFSALISLTCGAYAMGDDSPSLEETKGGRNALRASCASWGGDQESNETEVSSSSPASSTQNSFFPNSEEQVAFTWDALKQAGDFTNRDKEPRARNLTTFLHEIFSSKMKAGVLYELPILQNQLDGSFMDLMQHQSQISKAIEDANAASPASSVPNSLFSNDDAKVTFTWSALTEAVERGESRAITIHSFLIEKYRHEGIEWGKTPLYKMPFLQGQLDADLWAISEPFQTKLDIAVGLIPTTRDATAKLAAATGRYVSDTVDHKGREIELRMQALKAVETIETLKGKLSSTEVEYESFQAIRLQELAAKEEAERQFAAELEESKAQTAAKEEAERQFAAELEESKAQTAAKEEAERQLTSQLTALVTELETSRAQTAAKEEAEKQLTARFAALQAEFEAFKAESQRATERFEATLAEKDANNQRLRSAVDDVKATLASAGELLASLSTQVSE
ncbi:MAG: hypothetical protein K2X28_06070 [Alphaproteobacteria bacterium]|nr:hypothetical protein [Alphaproteobacteria bacterium]